MAEKNGSPVLEKRSSVKPKEPRKYAVILLNDNSTTFEFVIEVLMIVFNKSFEDAKNITLEIHEKQKGVAGIFMKEIAVSKSEEVQELAKKKRYPLKSIVEAA